jgi:hypothetical protein
MSRTLLLLIAVVLGGVLLGCNQGPGVASEQETQESMEATLSFDPMNEIQPDDKAAASKSKAD